MPPMGSTKRGRKFLIAYFFSALFAIGSSSNVEGDPCSLIIRGGQSHSDGVRVVNLPCKQGTLVWSRPRGALLIRFSFPSGVGSLDDSLSTESTSSARRLCIRYPDLNPSTSSVSITRLVGSKLESSQVEADELGDNKSYCTQIELSGAPPPSFLVKFAENGAAATFTLHYHTTTVDYERDSKNNSQNYTPTQRYCGNCNEQEFFNAYCSANFVFKGRLLREAPHGNGVEYSVEKIRRWPTDQPSNLVSKVHPKSGIRTTVLSSQCPKGTVKVAGFYSDLVVAADVREGVTQLLCAIMAKDFERLKGAGLNSTACKTDDDQSDDGNKSG